MNDAVRFRRVCRTLSVLFLLAVLLRLAGAAPVADPFAGTPVWGCNLCDLRQELWGMVPTEISRTEIDARMRARLQAPGTSTMLLVAQAVELLPFLAVFLSLSLAFRSLARSGLNDAAIRWLKRAALASVFLALSLSVSRSIALTVFSPVVLGRETRVISIDGLDLLWPLLLAGAAWASAWALGSAVALRQELENYV